MINFNFFFLNFRFTFPALTFDQEAYLSALSRQKAC